MATAAELEYLRRQAASANANKSQNLDPMSQGSEAATGNVDANAFERTWGTLSSISSGVQYGVNKAFEGIIDFGANVIGGLFGGGWFGAENDLTRAMTDFQKKDLAGDWQQLANQYGLGGVDQFLYYHSKNGWGADSFDWNNYDSNKTLEAQTWGKELGEEGYSTVKGIEQTVGQMIPQIGLSIAGGQAVEAVGNLANATSGATAGLNGLATATRLGTAGAIAASQYGQSGEEALNEGATLQQASSYGAMNAGFTFVLESLLGELGMNKLSGSASDKIVGNITNFTGSAIAGKIASKLIEAGGEGLQEVIEGAIEPVFKQITFDSQALDEAYGSDEARLNTAKQLATSFFIAGLVSGGFDMVGEVYNTKQYKKYVAEHPGEVITQEQIDNFNAKNNKAKEYQRKENYYIEKSKQEGISEKSKQLYLQRAEAMRQKAVEWSQKAMEYASKTDFVERLTKDISEATKIAKEEGLVTETAYEEKPAIVSDEEPTPRKRASKKVYPSEENGLDANRSYSGLTAEKGDYYADGGKDSYIVVYSDEDGKVHKKSTKGEVGKDGVFYEWSYFDKASKPSEESNLANFLARQRNDDNVGGSSIKNADARSLATSVFQDIVDATGKSESASSVGLSIKKVKIGSNIESLLSVDNITRSASRDNIATTRELVHKAINEGEIEITFDTTAVDGYDGVDTDTYKLSDWFTEAEMAEINAQADALVDAIAEGAKPNKISQLQAKMQAKINEFATKYLDSKSRGALTYKLAHKADMMLEAIEKNKVGSGLSTGGWDENVTTNAMREVLKALRGRSVLSSSGAISGRVINVIKGLPEVDVEIDGKKESAKFYTRDALSEQGLDFMYDEQVEAVFNELTSKEVVDEMTNTDGSMKPLTSEQTEMMLDVLSIWNKQIADYASGRWQEQRQRAVDAAEWMGKIQQATKGKYGVIQNKLLQLGLDVSNPEAFWYMLSLGDKSSPVYAYYQDIKDTYEAKRRVRAKFNAQAIEIVKPLVSNGDKTDLTLGKTYQERSNTNFGFETQTKIDRNVVYAAWLNFQSMTNRDIMGFYQSMNMTDASGNVIDNAKASENGERLYRIKFESGKVKGFYVEFTEAELNAAYDALSSDEKSALSKVQELYNGDLKQYFAQKRKEVYGSAGIVDDVYYPRTVDVERQGKELANDGADFQMDASGSQRYTKSRTNTLKQGLQANNVANTLFTYIQGLANFGEQYNAFKNMSYSFNTKIDPKGTRLSSAFDRISPNAYSRYIRSLVKKWNDINVTKGGDAWYNRLFSRAATSVLGLNVSSMLKQIGSLPTAAMEIGWNDVGKAVNPANLASFKEYDAYLKGNGSAFDGNGVYMSRVTERGAVTGRTLGEPFQYALGKTERALDKMGEAVTKHVELMDRSVVLSLFSGLVSDETNIMKGAKLSDYTAKDAGMDEKSYDALSDADKRKYIAMKNASDRLTDVILYSQSNSDNIALSRLRSGEMGNMSRNLFGIFASDGQNKISYLVRDMASYYYAKKVASDANIDNSDPIKVSARKIVESKATANRILMQAGTLTASGIISTLASMLADWVYGNNKDKTAQDRLADFAEEAYLSWIPFASTLSRVITNNGDLSYMGLETITNFFSKGKELVLAIQSGNADAIRSKTIQLGGYMASLFGLPANNAYKLVHGVTDKFSPETALEMKSFVYNTQATYEQSPALYVRDRVGEVSAEVLNAMTDVDAVPTSIPNKYTLESGEEKTISWTDQQTAKRYYSKANSVARKMVTSTAYLSLSDDAKAYAIRKLYSAYKEVALSKIKVGSVSSSLALLASANQQDMAAIVSALAYIRSLEGDSKKAKALAYVNSLSLSRNDKMLILSLAGYKVDESMVKSALLARGMAQEDVKTFLA